jgi:hypothetical protein
MQAASKLSSYVTQQKALVLFILQYGVPNNHKLSLNIKWIHLTHLTCHIAFRVIPTPKNLKPPACNGLDVIGKQLKQLTAPMTSSIKLAASGVVAGGAPPAIYHT